MATLQDGGALTESFMLLKRLIDISNNNKETPARDYCTAVEYLQVRLATCPFLIGQAVRIFSEQHDTRRPFHVFRQ